MAMKPFLEEFDILVKRVKSVSEKDNRAIFDAIVMEWRPRKKEWTQTKQVVTCVGYFYDIVVNDKFHVKAEEVEHPIFGAQWQIYASERIEPGTYTEMVKFLTSIKGIGTAIAKKLVDEFGLDLISTILADANVLNRLSLPQPARDSLYKAIIDNQSYEQLLVFLQLHNISPHYTTEIYKKYGGDAVDKICDNPYSLYLDEVIDFPAAVLLDLSIGGNIPKRYRNEAAVLACLRDDAETNGNLFMEADELPGKLDRYLRRTFQNQVLTIPDEREIEDALGNLAAERFIIVDGTITSGRPIYLSMNYYAEANISRRLCEMMTAVKDISSDIPTIRAAIERYVSEKSVPLSGEQRLAIQTALSSPVSILTGGPGTGKTQTLTTLVNVAKALWPEISIRICAPTGKAAMRAQELTQIASYTIHRAIGYPNRMLEEDELKCGLLIADEYSMCDAQLCSWLFRALWSGARLLIVGDHEQLPSVGPGLVLRDLIDCGMIPVTKLTTIFRQSGKSYIVPNAHSIINTAEGKEVKIEWSESPGGDFYFVKAKSQRRVQQRIIDCIHRMRAEGFPLDQIAVLSPVHGGLIGTDTLNAILQEELNPVPITGDKSSYSLFSGGELRIGDKVIQTHNNYDISVFNGETGTVKQIFHSAEKAILVEYPNKDVWYTSSDVEDLELAYAITTHRSQGSEFQSVIIPVHESLLYNLNKNLLYTAITRAKKRVIIVGSKDAFAAALKKNGVMERKSNLLLRIQTEMLAV